MSQEVDFIKVIPDFNKKQKKVSKVESFKMIYNLAKQFIPEEKFNKATKKVAVYAVIFFIILLYGITSIIIDSISLINYIF